MAASHTEPSLHSPSLKTTKLRVGRPVILAPRASPAPMGRPWPRDPVAASTPGAQPGAGCSSRGLPALA